LKDRKKSISLNGRALLEEKVLNSIEKNGSGGAHLSQELSLEVLSRDSSRNSVSEPALRAFLLEKKGRAEFLSSRESPRSFSRKKSIRTRRKKSVRDARKEKEAQKGSGSGRKRTATIPRKVMCSREMTPTIL